MIIEMPNVFTVASFLNGHVVSYFTLIVRDLADLTWQGPINRPIR